MNALDRTHQLTWRMMWEGGRFSWQLRDEQGRRWAWVMQTRTAGWVGHVGNWGQLGPDAIPFDDCLETFRTAADGRTWAEQTIASLWNDLTWAVDREVDLLPSIGELVLV